jgi:hypothetical protein
MYVHNLTRECDNLRRAGEADRKAIESLKRERDIIMKTIIKAKDKSKSQNDQVIFLKNNIKKLENESSGYSKEATKLCDQIYTLQKEKERYGIEKS